MAILDGDSKYGFVTINGEKSEIELSMPYLSGPALCDISNKFGLQVSYGSGAQSRWMYLNDLLDYCIQNKQESELLVFLFSKEQFIGKLEEQTPEIIEYAYTQIINTVIKHINGILYFSGNELVKVGKQYIVQKKGTNIEIVVPSLKIIDRSYIIDLSNRAMNDVKDGNYDSAITKSRTLLEEVFCYVIEKKDVKPSETGNIKKLYTQVKQLYNMHQDKEMDKRINELLSGLEKILTAIAEMRNIGSDSHGVGAKRINIQEYHARLLVNASMTMADFILAVSENATKY